MHRRPYRKRRPNDGLSSILLIAAIVVILALYNKITSQVIELIGIISLSLAGLTLALVLFIHYRRAQYEERKLRAIHLTGINSMDGLTFEKYVAKLLKSQGYTKVTLTERYDLGVDIVAIKDGVRWGVQVKRYSGMVMAEAVRQVVTALNAYRCQRAMVVTNSTFSRPAKILAKTNNCVLVGKDELAQWILAFHGQAEELVDNVLRDCLSQVLKG